MKKLYYTFLILVIFLFSNTVVLAKTVKVSVLSDIHIKLTQDKEGNYVLTPSINNLQRAIKQINISDVNYVVFSGDCVDNTSKEAVVMFAKIINSLKKPYYVIMGNHDVAQVLGVDKKKFFHLMNRFSHNRIKKVPSVKVVDNNLVFIFMDGVNQFIPGAKGYFKEPELMWLDKKLDKYKGRNVVIFQHYPLVEPYANKSHKTFNADEYLALLKKHNNVKAVVSGHYHAENEIEQEGILHVSIPALVQSGQYKQIDIEYDGLGNDFVIKSKMQEAI